MIFLFLCKLRGMEVMAPYGAGDVVGVVEGDDGLFRTKFAPPTEEEAARLGFVLKIDHVDVLSEASFCGIVSDEEDLINVTDVQEVVATFGWSGGEMVDARPMRLRMMLRAKSLSYLYQYSGCPVVQELALYGLRMTTGLDIKPLFRSADLCGWERDRLVAALERFSSDGIVDKFKIKAGCRTPPANTRALVERKFGVTVEQQLASEEYLRNKTDLSPLVFAFEFPSVWTHYFTEYSFTTVYEAPSPIRDFPYSIYKSVPRKKM